MKLDKYLEEFKLHNGELYYKDILMTRNDKYFYKNGNIIDLNKARIINLNQYKRMNK